jgi:integrase/recombinase XerD
MNIAQLLARPHDMSVGETAPYLEGFATEMAAVGYTGLTIGGYVDSAVHFGGWLRAQGVSLPDIDENTVEAFGAHQCQCPGHRSHRCLSRHYVARS